jgi:hypothetical protein
MANIRTIVFPINPKPLSEDCSIQNIYLTIGSVENKSYFLKRICDYENETIQLIRRGEQDKDNFILQEVEGCEPLKTDILKALYTGDVYDMDWDAFNPDNTYSCMMLLDGDSYVGHVYCWDNGDTLKMQGIRSSILNLYKKTVRPVSKYLVEAVLQHAKDNEYGKVLVVEPIYVMPKILESMGFTRTLNEEGEPDLDFEKRI